MKSYVYIIFNARNGKLYVGWTSNPRERWRKHRKNAGLNQRLFLYRALAKELDNFEFRVISEHQDEDEAMEAERYWVSFFQSNDDRFGYNMTEGGDGCVRRGPANALFGRKGPLNHNFGRRYKSTVEAVKNRVASRMSKLQPGIETRKQQALEVLKDGEKRGTIVLLSIEWGVSHTQVRRFLNKHIPPSFSG